MLHSYAYTFVQISCLLATFFFYFKCSFESANKIFIFHFATCSMTSVTSVYSDIKADGHSSWVDLSADCGPLRQSAARKDICSWGAWWEGKVQMLRPRFLTGLCGVRGGTASQQDCKPATDSSWKSSNRRPFDKRSSVTEDILRRPVPPWPACMRLSPSLHTTLPPEPPYLHLEMFTKHSLELFSCTSLEPLIY